jgi:hypothetical protein
MYKSLGIPEIDVNRNSNIISRNSGNNMIIKPHNIITKNIINPEINTSMKEPKNFEEEMLKKKL